MTTLEHLPALTVLERLPVPVLAVGQDGTILFANSEFAALLGYPPAELLSLNFGQIFHTHSVNESAVAVVRAHAQQVVELVHAEGWIVRATMSKSALLRGDDPVALAMFQDSTERLWVEDR